MLALYFPQLSLKGTSKNAIHGIFLDGKAKNAGFAFLHFQSLVVIENGSTSLCRPATSIFRGALKSVGWADERNGALLGPRPPAPGP